MHVDSPLYRKAFEAYLRKGTPIASFVKRARTTTHYIWRTQRDNKVRPSHRANEGKIFSWDSPPPTGHPGEAPNCRCYAEPHIQGGEQMRIRHTGYQNTGSRRWSDFDMAMHYLFGNGKTVILREVGLLEDFVNRYKQIGGQNLLGKIADKARANIGQSFSGEHPERYNMRPVVWSLGGVTVIGEFSGTCSLKKGLIFTQGRIKFIVEETYKDVLDPSNKYPDDEHPPYDLPIAQIYDVTDEWRGSFSGYVLQDRSRSRYRYDKK